MAKEIYAFLYMTKENDNYNLVTHIASTLTFQIYQRYNVLQSYQANF